MLEVAFQQIQNVISDPSSQSAVDKDEFIAGYYEIPATLVNNLAISPFSQRIGDKINQIQVAGNSSNSCAVPENTELDESRDPDNSGDHNSKNSVASRGQNVGKITHSTLVLSMDNPSGKFLFYVKKFVENSGKTSYSDLALNNQWTLEEIRGDLAEEYNIFEEKVDSILRSRVEE